MRYLVLAAAVVLAPGCFAQDQFLTGSLERVMERSITVLLSDSRLFDARLPKRGKLAGAGFGDTYKFASQVRIRCKSIPLFWDKAAELPRTLELADIQLLREPSPEELSAAIRCRDWRRPGNLLQPPKDATTAASKPLPAMDAGPGAILERARAVNLERAAHMPSFVADEIMDCYVSSPGLADWQHSASVRSEVRFTGMTARRQRVTRNGKALAVPGFVPGCMGSSGGFGTYLRPLFDPECATTFTYSSTINQPGGEDLIYVFRTPPEGCFETSFSGSERAYPTHAGLVTIQASGGDMMHVESESVALPGAYPITLIKEEVSWGFVNIGETRLLLPISYEKVMWMSSGLINRVSATYVNHRHFEASSKITFE
jgi:hypothetical protein